MWRSDIGIKVSLYILYYRMNNSIRYIALIVIIYMYMIPSTTSYLGTDMLYGVWKNIAASGKQLFLLQFQFSLIPW